MWIKYSKVRVDDNVSESSDNPIIEQKEYSSFIKAGDFILLDLSAGRNFFKSFFSLEGQIKFWCKSKWTNVAQGIYHYHTNYENLIFETSNVSLADFWIKYESDMNIHYRIYRWKDLCHQQIFGNTSNRIFYELNGSRHSFSELLSFIYRKIITSLRLPAKSVKNYIYTEEVATSLKKGCELANKECPNEAFDYVINYYNNCNDIHIGDIENILEELKKKGLLIVIGER